MANAYKCDRCGAYYSNDNRARRYVIHDYNRLPINRSMDLCDGCHAMLTTFVTGEPFGCVVNGVDMDDLEAVKAEVERRKEECRELKAKLGMIHQLTKERDHL